MGTNLQKYQSKEILNKVLNTGEDALKVDIDNVTIDNANLEVKLDSANDSVAIKAAVEADIATMQDDIALTKADVATMQDDTALIKADIALIKADIAAVKAVTDKLDDCIVGSDSNAKLSVDVKASVPVPVS